MYSIRGDNIEANVEESQMRAKPAFGNVDEGVEAEGGKHELLPRKELGHEGAVEKAFNCPTSETQRAKIDGIEIVSYAQ